VPATELPLATVIASAKHVNASYYDAMSVRPIYRSYAIYAPGREPHGYWESLKLREPEIVFDVSKLRTKSDWIRAGELVFHAPTLFDRTTTVAQVRSPDWYRHIGVKLLPDGTMPYLSYVIRENLT